MQVMGYSAAAARRAKWCSKMGIKLGKIVGILGRMAAGNRDEGFAIDIGTQAEILERRSVTTLKFGRAGPNVDTYQRYMWRRKRGRRLIRPALEPNPHMVVFGMSGQGKSTLLRHMLLDIARGGRSAIVFDAHNEHEAVVSGVNGRVYDASRHSLNIFELDGVSVAQRVHELTMLFKDVFRLGHVQASKLGECMWYAYRRAGAASKDDTALPKVPSMQDLLAELYVFTRNAKSISEKRILGHLISRITLLGSGWSAKDSVPLAELRHGISSFSLAGIRSPEAQMLYIGELLRRLYGTMKESQKEEGIGMYVVLDEAQFLMDASESGGRFVNRLAAEGRKYGLGVIIATHLATMLDRRVIANASTFITFYPREPAEINYVAGLLAGGCADAAAEIKARMARLRQNEAMVLSGATKQVGVVRTADFRDLPEARKREADGPARAGILDRAKVPVKYDSVATTQAEGDEVRRLLAEGELDSVDTADGTWIMAKKGSQSAEHEVCVRSISERLRAMGIEHVVVNNGTGPDIVAYAGGKRIAVEYETGRKHAKDTAEMLKRRAAEYPKTLVFVNSDAFGFYSNNFGSPTTLVIDIDGLGCLDAEALN